jgi:hypothetical protein
MPATKNPPSAPEKPTPDTKKSSPSVPEQPLAEDLPPEPKKRPPPVSVKPAQPDPQSALSISEKPIKLSQTIPAKPPDSPKKAKPSPPVSPKSMTAAETASSIKPAKKPASAASKRTADEPDTSQLGGSGDLLARVRRSVAAAERLSLQKLVASLQTERNKAPILRTIGEYLEASSGKDFEAVLPALVRLCKSDFASEVERVLEIIGTTVQSADLLDVIIPLLIEPDPCCFIEFITRIISCANREDLVPRVRPIMANLAPLLQDSVPEVRKYSVLCVVEMRLVIGDEFAPEVDALKVVPRKLVLHYFQKRLES